MGISTQKGQKMQKKETKMDIIRTFRRFARLRLDKCDANPIQIYKKIDVLCSSRRSKLDMLAVYDTMRLLEINGEDDVLDAIRSVYFFDLSHRLTSSTMSDLVKKYATDSFCDARTAYRRLERARIIYEKIREREGLISDRA